MSYQKLAVLILLSTAIFFLQHAGMQNQWDFHAYILNGEYWFHHGRYFSPMRPPLVPFILGLLGFVSRGFAEYGYILFASALFAFSSVRLARVLRLPPVWFYALVCSAYLMTHGLNEGTELLNFAFLELFVGSLLLERFAGHWLGLMILSRYTGVAFAPLLIFRRKEAWKDVVLCALTLFSWLAYNYLKFGNPLTSFADLYANNIYSRVTIAHPWRIEHFAEVGGLSLPLILIGAFWRPVRRENVMMAVIAFLTTVSYANIPFKNSRFLFSLALPAGVWAAEGLKFLATRIGKVGADIVAWALFIVNFMFSLSTLANARAGMSLYINAIEDLKRRNLDHCSIESNGWVELNYYGLLSKPCPYRETLAKEIRSGEIVLLFRQIKDPPYAQNPRALAEFPVISETDRYVILGNGCKPAEPYTELFAHRFADYFQATRGYRSEERPLYLLFGSFHIL